MKEFAGLLQFFNEQKIAYEMHKKEERINLKYQGKLFTLEKLKSSFPYFQLRSTITLSNNGNSNYEQLVQLSNRLNDENKAVRVIVDDDGNVQFCAVLIPSQDGDVMRSSFRHSTGCILRTIMEYKHYIKD